MKTTTPEIRELAEKLIFIAENNEPFTMEEKFLELLSLHLSPAPTKEHELIKEAASVLRRHSHIGHFALVNDMEDFLKSLDGQHGGDVTEKNL